MNQSNAGQSQTLIDHLVELRIRVTRAVFGIAVGFGLSYAFSEHLMDVIRKPIQPFLPNGGGLTFLGVMDKFLAHLKVSLLSGVILTCPWWLYQAWKFIAPGLYENEKRFAIGFIGAGSFLFCTGVLFAYFLVYPAAFHFLLNFGGTTDTPMITLSEYLSFFVTTTLVFGAAFELPLVITVLGLLGIVDEKVLRNNRRYAIVVLAAISAILTPPDALSMFMLLVPLVLLYELSIFFVIAFNKKKKSTVPNGDQNEGR